MLKSPDGNPFYNSMMPIYPLLAQQCADDYRLDNYLT